MAKTMTASQKPMTIGQVDNLVAKFRAALTKHRSEMTAQTAQQVLGVENLGTELYGVIRTHAEHLSTMFSRTVTVDRTLTPQQALDATSRVQYTDKHVVAAMPRGTGTTREAVFCKLGRFVSGNNLEQALADHLRAAGLNPDEWEIIDPFTLAKVNQDDPAFADTHPNGTHFKDVDGKWCFAAFDRWDGGRSVIVDRYEGGWDDCWWFASVRKS